MKRVTTEQRLGKQRCEALVRPRLLSRYVLTNSHTHAQTHTLLEHEKHTTNTLNTRWKPRSPVFGLTKTKQSHPNITHCPAVIIARANSIPLSEAPLLGEEALGGVTGGIKSFLFHCSPPHDIGRPAASESAPQSSSVAAFKHFCHDSGVVSFQSARIAGVNQSTRHQSPSS
jgi:hypothetical protein